LQMSVQTCRSICIFTYGSGIFLGTEDYVNTPCRTDRPEY